MHFQVLSAICFNLDQSKILSSGNGLICNTSISRIVIYIIHFFRFLSTAVALLFLGQQNLDPSKLEAPADDSFEISCLSLTLNPFPNNPWFLHVCSSSLLKTLWEKEKLLVMSNFSFFHSVFCPFR